jgi:hypothetical protein
MTVAKLRRSSLDCRKFKLLKQQKAFQKELKLKSIVHGMLTCPVVLDACLPTEEHFADFARDVILGSSQAIPK